METKIVTIGRLDSPESIEEKLGRLGPYQTTGGLDTVAVRMPSHPLAKLLSK